MSENLKLIINEIKNFFPYLKDEEIKFWEDQYMQIASDKSKKGFYEFLISSFELYKKNDNKENINYFRFCMANVANFKNTNFFNPIFSPERSFSNFLEYADFLRNGGEGKEYRTQLDLSVMIEFLKFTTKTEDKKKENIDGQEIFIFNGKNEEKFIIADIVDRNRSNDVLNRYIEYLKNQILKINGNLNIIIPQSNKDNTHWTLKVVKVSSKGRKICKKIYNSLEKDDLTGLIKIRQKGDLWTCGIHAMEAAFSLITGENLSQFKGEETGECLIKNRSEGSQTSEDFVRNDSRYLLEKTDSKENKFLTKLKKMIQSLKQTFQKTIFKLKYKIKKIFSFFLKKTSRKSNHSKTENKNTSSYQEMREGSPDKEEPMDNKIYIIEKFSSNNDRVALLKVSNRLLGIDKRAKSEVKITISKNDNFKDLYDSIKNKTLSDYMGQKPEKRKIEAEESVKIKFLRKFSENCTSRYL